MNCSVLSDSVRPWTVAHDAPSSTGFPRQEYCSGLPFPSPGGLPNPGIKSESPALQVDSLLSWATREYFTAIKSEEIFSCCDMEISPSYYPPNKVENTVYCALTFKSRQRKHARSHRLDDPSDPPACTAGLPWGKAVQGFSLLNFVPWQQYPHIKSLITVKI